MQWTHLVTIAARGGAEAVDGHGLLGGLCLHAHGRGGVVLPRARKLLGAIYKVVPGLRI